MPLVSNVCFLHRAKETYIIQEFILTADVYEQYNNTIITERMKMKLNQNICRYATHFLFQ